MSEKDRAGVIGNTLKTLGEVRLCGFRVMQPDRQTDRLTDRRSDIFITILRITPGGEVAMTLRMRIV